MAIRYEKEDHVVTIMIDRYDKRNALDVEHSQGLIAAWKAFDADPDAWVAIVTGVQDAFCAGGDLAVMGRIAEELRTTGASPTRDALRDPDGGSPTLKGIDIYKPIIAAVNGLCIAGGMELLGGTDIRIASSSAYFQIAEPRRGLIAGGGTTSRLPRQLTWPAAMELLLLANRVDAERAETLGLVNLVVPPEDLMDTARRIAQEITRSAPLAIQGTKKSALLGLQAGSLAEAFAIEDQVYGEVFATRDATEGTAAFLEKREPTWKGN
ncbi:enoyl-CoA hydratase/isomerase family protein [Rhodococcus olei]|uniref:Enoyl-CoA hydratase/isomerase family protein n=1 Tax=Rhodococcus olei TaxID=2161675 RepID=A0ABP8PUV6_9NOCA